MATIIVKEVLKKTADPTIIDDVDRLILTVEYNSKEYRVTIPWTDITSTADFKAKLIEAAQKVKDKPKVINLTEKWKGTYTI